MRLLLLLRHASAGGRAPGGRDHDRPLSERGRAEARLLGAHLARSGRAPALIVCSSAARATQTAVLVAEALDFPGGDIAVDGRLYLAEPEDLLEVIGGVHRAVDEILMVAHNPGLSELASRSSRQLLGLPPCGLADLAFDAPDWGAISSSPGSLAGVITPDTLG